MNYYIISYRVIIEGTEQKDLFDAGVQTDSTTFTKEHVEAEVLEKLQIENPDQPVGLIEVQTEPVTKEWFEASSSRLRYILKITD